jgi:hypothetical protein
LVVLEMGISQSICPGGPQTTILPISASQVARITGMSHQYRLDQYFDLIYGRCEMWPYPARCANEESNKRSSFGGYFHLLYILTLEGATYYL